MPDHKPKSACPFCGGTYNPRHEGKQFSNCTCPIADSMKDPSFKVADGASWRPGEILGLKPRASN